MAYLIVIETQGGPRFLGDCVRFYDSIHTCRALKVIGETLIPDQAKIILDRVGSFELILESAARCFHEKCTDGCYVTKEGRK